MSQQQADILIPTYNGEKYIAETIHNILAQEKAAFHIYICDDGSTDRTVEIITRITDPRITLFQGNKHQGLVGNWNECLRISRSPFINIFHQDDLMCPFNIQSKIAYLHNNPNIGFLFSNMNTIDKSGKVVGGHWYPNLPEQNTILSGHDFFQLLLLKGNVVPCSSVFMRKDLINAVGFFNPLLHYTPDYEMWLRLSLFSDVGYLSSPLIKVRTHRNQESTKFIGKSSEIHESLRAINFVMSEYENFIPNVDEDYYKAINHLIEWSTFFLKNAIKQFNIKETIRLSLILIKLLAMQYISIPFT